MFSLHYLWREKYCIKKHKMNYIRIWNINISGGRLKWCITRSEFKQQNRFAIRKVCTKVQASSKQICLRDLLLSDCANTASFRASRNERSTSNLLPCTRRKKDITANIYSPLSFFEEGCENIEIWGIHRELASPMLEGKIFLPTEINVHIESKIDV